MCGLPAANGPIAVETGTNLMKFVIKPLAYYIDINEKELRMVLKITNKMKRPQRMARSTLWLTTSFIPSSNSLP